MTKQVKENKEMGKEQDLLMHHEYDGIQELDNNLPPWWVHLFNITIVFSVVYLLYYHVFDIGVSSAEEYELEFATTSGTELVESMGTQYGYQSPLSSFPEKLVPRMREQFKYYIGEEVTFEQLIAEAKLKATDEQLKQLITGVSKIETVAESNTSGSVTVSEEVSVSITNYAPNPEAGKAVYIQSCAVCHGQNGEGLIGPNMVDKYWIHGGTKEDIVKTINVGVPVKGMVPWKGVITDQQINDVSDFILSLQGTNPPNQKAAEGDLVK